MNTSFSDGGRGLQRILTSQLIRTFTLSRHFTTSSSSRHQQIADRSKDDSSKQSSFRPRHLPQRVNHCGGDQRGRMIKLLAYFALTNVVSAWLAPRIAHVNRRSEVLMMGRWFENNKEKMAKTAAAYAKSASYIGKKIQLCAQENGPNPDNNRKLGLLMREAKV